MKLQVWPLAAMADEFLNIYLEGLKPDILYSFLLSIVDETSVLFRAHAHYKANSDGCIDLRRDAALQTKREDLFSLLKPTKPYKRLIPQDVRRPFQYVLSIWKVSEPELFPLPFITDEYLQRFTVAITARIPSALIADWPPDVINEGMSNDFSKLQTRPGNDLNFDELRLWGLLAIRRIDRHFVASGVQRIKVREGRIRGALFVPKGRKGIFVAL